MREAPAQVWRPVEPRKPKDLLPRLRREPTYRLELSHPAGLKLRQTFFRRLQERE